MFMRNSIKITFLTKWRRRIRIFRRKYIRIWWQAYQWPIIGVVAFIALVLGYIGFNKYFIALGQSRSTFDIIYLTLQLFVMESGSMSSPISWELELARWLTPALAAYTAVRAIAVIFHEQLQLFRVRFISDHIIICGLGRKGLLLVQRFSALGYKVLVIEKNEGNNMISQCGDEGAIVLIGNATDPNLLKKARVPVANHLISVCGDDGVNAEVAVRVRELVGDRKGNVLTCIIHIVNPQLYLLLGEKEIGTGRVDTFRLEFFNNFNSGARAWLKEHPAFDEVTGKAKDAWPHLLIVGIGRMGESLIVHLAKKWKDLSPSIKEKLHINIIDNAAAGKLESLCLRYPRLKNVCDIIPLQMNIESSDFQRADFLFDNQKKCNISSIFVCLDNDSSALSAALVLYNRLRKYKIPIVLRMTHDKGLASLLKSDIENGGSFEGLTAFGLLDKTFTPELILDGTHEILARAIHDSYRFGQEEKGKTFETNVSMVAWDELPENLKESNRRQADHIGIKLKAIGCAIAPMTDWDTELFKFSEKEIELMARMEHERWMSERLQDGWTFKEGRKNVERKTSPDLVPTEKLTKDAIELDNNPVKDLPLYLAKVGFQIYRISKASIK